MVESEGVRLYTIPEASKLLRLSPKHIYKMCKARTVDAKRTWLLRLPIKEQTIGIKAIAETLNVSKEWVESLCRSKRIKAVKVGGQWRVELSEAAKLALFGWCHRKDLKRLIKELNQNN